MLLSLGGNVVSGYQELVAMALVATAESRSFVSIVKHCRLDLFSRPLTVDMVCRIEALLLPELNCDMFGDPTVRRVKVGAAGSK